MGASGKDESRIKAKIKRRLKAYEEWPTNDKSKAGGASRIAEDIARSYAYVGDQAKATEYFMIAANHCATAIINAPITELRPDQAGSHFFHCGRITWHAGELAKARNLFRQALDHYRRGYEHEQGGVRRMCRQYSIYCHIFLGNYAEAERNAEIKAELEATSGLEHPGSDVKLMKQVARLLHGRDRENIEHAHDEIRKFIEKEKLTEYAARPDPVVDIKDYILSLLAEKGEEGEGQDQAG